VESFPTSSPLSAPEIVHRLNSIPRSIYENKNVRFVYLGGSAAKGTLGWWSDIDVFLSVEGIRNKSVKDKLETWLSLNFIMAEITKLDKIDINFIEDLPLHIQLDILRTGIIVYDNGSGQRQAFLEGLLNRVYDHNLWYRKLIEESTLSWS